MTQGLNLKADIWRMNQASDDSVGGAVITGTVVYSGLPVAITPTGPTQQSLEQGLEVNQIYRMTSRWQGIELRERDEVEVVWPPGHPFYQLRFRIMGIDPSRKRPRFGNLHVNLSRIRQSRRQQ